MQFSLCQVHLKYVGLLWNSSLDHETLFISCHVGFQVKFSSTPICLIPLTFKLSITWNYSMTILFFKSQIFYSNGRWPLRLYSVKGALCHPQIGSHFKPPKCYRNVKSICLLPEQTKQPRRKMIWKCDYHQLMNVQYSFQIGGKNIIILDESSWRTSCMK
jgi:hypothetical protein